MSISSRSTQDRRPNSHLFTAAPIGHAGSASDQDLVDQLLADNANMKARLSSLPTIEQAKGILICRYRIDANAAFLLLRGWSCHTNTKLNAISALLVQAATQTPTGVRAAEQSSLEQLLAALESGHLPDTLAI